MSAFVFPFFKGQLLAAALDFPGATIRAALLTSAPATTAQFLADVSPGAPSSRPLAPTRANRLRSAP